MDNINENNINEESVRNKSKPRTKSTSTLEDLPDDLRGELYNERHKKIVNDLKEIVISELEIAPEDLIDSLVF
jgi:hypothetical protein